MKLKITLAMLMCGLGAAAAAGIAGAAPADLEVRTLAVKYDPTAKSRISLVTTRGWSW